MQPVFKYFLYKKVVHCKNEQSIIQACKICGYDLTVYIKMS